MTFLLKALFCQSTPSPLKVGGGGGGGPGDFIASTGTGGTLYSLFYSQVPGPSPKSQVPIA